jgi:hypothetical protein
VSNRRRPKRFHIATGERIPGGCHDCDAYQVVTEEAPGVFVLQVHHDPGCPFLAGVTR